MIILVNQQHTHTHTHTYTHTHTHTHTHTYSTNTYIHTQTRYPSLSPHHSGGFDKVDDYRQLLVRALHSIGVRFPEITATLVPQLMEYLVDTTDVNPRVLPPG